MEWFFSRIIRYHWLSLFHIEETVTQWWRNIGTGVCVCVCFQLCCSNTFRVNVFVMRIFYLSRFYAALIHRAAYRACGLISPANGETPVSTPDAHFPFSTFYSMCSWLKKKKKNNLFHTWLFFTHRIRRWNASRPTEQTHNAHLEASDGRWPRYLDHWSSPLHQSASSQTTLKGIT